ncbi:MAG: NFACT RNA binding domain-containing protein [archaeon]
MVNFREYVTSSGLRVLGGKSESNNEELISQVSPTEIVIHTAQPGSPFVNIKGAALKRDIKEAAVFCAKYSQDWRDSQRDVFVHVFRGADVYKDRKMKLGTFGVKKFDVLKIKKEYILKFEKSLREIDDKTKPKGINDETY